MSYFGKNIRKIRNIKNMSQQSFADLFDLKRGTLGAYEEGRSEPKIETIITVANYFSISIDDLLTKELTVNRLLKFKGDFSLNKEDKIKEIFAEVPCITDNNNIDYPKNYHDDYFIESLPVLNLPINPKKKFRGFTVNNLEMTNHDQGLYPNDIVVGEFVPSDIYSKINNGSMVLVLVNSKMILRRLYITKKEVTLRADHKNIEDLHYKLTDLKEMWKIRYVFYKRIPENQSFSQSLEDKMSFLEKEILKLKNK